jgi:hypothetical protein
MPAILNQSAITPEQEIVFASIRVDHKEDDRLVQLVQGRVDWSVASQFALHHGVLPLFYTRLKDLGKDLVPTAELEGMRELFLLNAQRNLRLTRLLVRLHDLFSGHGIGFIPLKGPLLSAQIYGDTSLRHFSDLDILIQEGDFHQADQLLKTAGFSPAFPLSEKTEPWLLRGDSEYSYSYQGDLLELQWAIAERGVSYPLSPEIFWEDLRAVELHDRQFQALSPENLALALLIHGGKHRWGKLMWITDIAHFKRTFPDFDWAHLLELAIAAGFYRIAGAGLLLAGEIGGAQLPPAIEAKITADNDLAAEAQRGLLTPAAENEFTGVSYFLRSRERFRDRAYYVLDQAFVPKQEDWQTISLPKVFYPAYTIYRPLRLLFKFFPQIIQNLFKKSA